MYLASILGYGDSLITLSLLERAGRAASNVCVVGTAVTRATADLMHGPPPIAEELFADVAAFYVIKQRGIAAALHDLLRFRRWAQDRLSPADTLVLEKRDPRTRWLVPKGACTVVEVTRGKSVYIDRETVLRPYIGEQHWQPCARPWRRGERLLINPSARASSKNLPTKLVEASLQVAAAIGTKVCLIDVAGHYEALRTHVDRYLRSPSLRDAALALRESDRYLGPDSFFVHLAYYYRVPFLAFFRATDTYFAPPGTSEQGNYVYYPDAVNEEHFRGKLHWFLSGEKA